MKRIALTETELIRLIKKVINEKKQPNRRRLREQGMGFNCEPQSGGCNCVTPVFGHGMYQTVQDCKNDTDNCCRGNTYTDKNHTSGPIAKKTPCPPGQVMGEYGCESPMPNKRSLREQSSGTITQPMIQRCKYLLNNVQGTNTSWKQNFKSTVMGKPCSWVRNRMNFFGGKMQNAVPGSGAHARFKAKTHFLECLVQACQS
tara:strand:+ start:120 stop:722 length:603 start_codon:yes stop_codon:yes gene_type:complete